MLSDREKTFMEYWEKHREKESNIFFQLMTGLPVGLMFALPILFILFTGKFWFKRADMAAHSQLNIGVLVGAVLFIAIFVAVFYKRHQWEMKEQQYKELKRKKSSLS